MPKKKTSRKPKAADYLLVAPEKTKCRRGHVLTAETERRAKHHTPYGRYIARVCRICARDYQQRRKARIAQQRLPRETRKGTRPARDYLATFVGQETWVEIGIRFGVSDVTARKWALAYGLVAV